MLIKQSVTWVQRAWEWVGHLGIEGHDRVVARYMMGSNHFLALAIAVAAVWAGVFWSVFLPGSWLPGASHTALIAVWCGCLALNARGFFVPSAAIALAAPVIQYVALAWMFSAAGGFQLVLLTVGALAFSVLPPRWWLLRVLVTAAALAAAVWTSFSGLFMNPGVEASAGQIRALLVGNMLATALLVVLSAAFSDYYLMRERRLAEALVDQAEYAAKTDALTNVINRRGLGPLLATAVTEGDYAIALADLDRFKRINDRLGHGTGDVVLANVARRLVLAVGDQGVVSRWGGEEFLILMPRVTATQALAIMERARAAVDRDFGADGVMEHVTLSAGVVHVPRGTSKEDALRIADKLLYEAKDAGRNRVLATAVVGLRHTPVPELQG